MQYVGISDERLHHIIGVARKAYSLAKELGYSEEFARKCFMLGWIHDVGYEFSYRQEDHPEISVKMLKDLVGNNDAAQTQRSLGAILNHGKEISDMTDEYRILTMADMLVDANGNSATVSQRLEDIRTRYGEYSVQYTVSCRVCRKIGLLDSRISPEPEDIQKI